MDTDRAKLGNCKVCLGKANGIHYSVISCEGCKVIAFSFFSQNFNLKETICY